MMLRFDDVIFIVITSVNAVLETTLRLALS